MLLNPRKLISIPTLTFPTFPPGSRRRQFRNLLRSRPLTTRTRLKEPRAPSEDMPMQKVPILMAGRDPHNNLDVARVAKDGELVLWRERAAAGVRAVIAPRAG